MEEQVLQVPIKGIMRNASIAQIENGGCDEIINLRFREGSWRPVYDKTLLATLTTQYDSVYKHNVSGAAAEIWIGFVSSSGKVYAHIMTSPSIAKIELLDIGTETFSRISHINNYLIVWTTTNRHILVWDSDNYNPPSTSGYTVLPDLPNIEMFVTSENEETDEFDYKDSYSEALAEYLTNIENLKSKGKYEGMVMVVAAYKLFDGTYIKHSQPYYIQLASVNTTALDLVLEVLNLGTARYRYRSEVGGILDNTIYGMPKIQFKFEASDITNIQTYKGIVESIDIFATYPKSVYRIFETDPSGGAHGTYPVLATDNEKYNEQQMAYYKIKSITPDMITSSEFDLTLPNSTDFIAADTLPVDNYSNHKLIGQNGINYNSRQHLGNITTVFGGVHNPFVNGADANYMTQYCDGLSGYTETGVTPLLIHAYIQTDYGEKIIEQLIYASYYTDGGGNQIIIQKPFVSYPDKRCGKIYVYIRDTSAPYAYSQWINYELIPHPIHNYAYKYSSYYGGDASHVHSIFKSPSFDKPVYGTNYNGDTVGAVTLPTADIYLNEPNRLQLSGINNPFYLPSMNSYRVGNMDDTIYGVQPSVAPVSENQFGQHPVFVFTRGAIYAMMVGENDVVYSAIIPVVNETFNSSSQFLPVRNGVVYTCERGLKYIEGRSVLDIDNFIREKPDGYLNADTAFMQLFTQAGNENLSTALSEQPFLIYLANAIMAYDNVEDELIISNPTESLGALSYDYSYVFNFKSQSWSKLSNGFSKFVNLFPGYAGLIKVTTTWKLYDISTEDINTRTQQCMIVTRPIKLSGSGYKRITKGFLMCNLSRYSGTFYFQFYVYGSVDGVVWKYISGKSIPKSADIIDIGINKHHVSCKYYIFVFHGNIDIDNTISFIDLQFANIANNKLR